MTEHKNTTKSGGENDRAMEKSSAGLLRGSASRRRSKITQDAVSEINRLRECGEYAAADDILDTLQSFLSELKSLEDWAIENSMPLDEFDRKSDEWEDAYNSAIRYVYKIPVSGGEFKTAEKDRHELLKGSGKSLLELGIMPSSEQLAAMEMTEAEAQVYMTAKKLKDSSQSAHKSI